jgi:hypothetical protein
MPRFKLTRNTEAEAKELFQVKLPKTLVADIHLMVTWAKRDRTDVVAEMLHFALGQEAEFQEYKKSKPSTSQGTSAGNDQHTKSPHHEKAIQATAATVR